MHCLTSLVKKSDESRSRSDILNSFVKDMFTIIYAGHSKTF